MLSPDPAPVPPRWKCVCAYAGGEFSGWQSQVGGGAIQDLIEKRLSEMLGVQTRIHASGRTDAGVHARGQVFHFDGDWRHGPDRFLAAMRVGLPAGIQVRSARIVPSNFHARYSATGKQYRYQLHLGDADPFLRPYTWICFKPLDFDRMEAAASVLLGMHDFRAFSAFNGTELLDTVRDLRRLEIRRQRKLVTIIAEADGFMYKMVRTLVGALVWTGEGKLTPARIRELLEARERRAEIYTAPPQGLCLQKVFYTGQRSAHAGDESDVE